MRILLTLKKAVDGLSPTAIAEKAKVSRTSIYDAIAGRDMKISTAQAIIDACEELKKKGRR